MWTRLTFKCLAPGAEYALPLHLSQCSLRRRYFTQCIKSSSSDHMRHIKHWIVHMYIYIMYIYTCIALHKVQQTETYILFSNYQISSSKVSFHMAESKGIVRKSSNTRPVLNLLFRIHGHFLIFQMSTPTQKNVYMHSAWAKY